MKKETLLDYWLVIYEHKKAVLTVTLASIATAILLSFTLPPVYEARAVCYVPDKSPSLSYMSPNSLDRFSRDLLVPKAKEDDAGPYIGLLKSVKIANYVHEEYPSKKVHKLLTMDVDFELSSEFLIRIYSRDKDPVLAANVANAYVKYLNIVLQEASANNSQSDNTVLQEQVKEVEARLRNARSDVEKFENKNNIASIDAEIKELTAQRTSFLTQLENVTVQIVENDEKIASTTEELQKEGKILSASDVLLTNPTIDHLREKLADLSAKIAVALVELKEAHPDVKMLRRQYEQTEERLKQETQKLLSSQIKPQNTFYEQLRLSLVSLVIEKGKLKSSAAGFSAAIERINHRLKRLPAIKARWTRLNDNVTHYTQVYEQLRLAQQENDLQQIRPINYVVTVDSATTPDRPSFPILWLNAVIATLAGLTTGVLFAFLLDYIQKTRKARTVKVIQAVLSAE